MTKAAKNVDKEIGEDPVDPMEALFISMDVAGQAINRLETFVFSATKLMVDKKIISFDDLARYMDGLQSYETLDKFWIAAPDEFERNEEEKDED